MNWWSSHYDRPLKDPLLLSYSYEELLYEYYSKAEYVRAKNEQDEAESDRIEEEKRAAAEAWADEMEAEELAMEEAQRKKDQEVLEPWNDPDNIKWMEEQMALDKELNGEQFGEDLNIDFGD
jgi:hypothetical protein